ncbi:unnamed protein product [Brassica rapa subsp. narinosa]
MIESSYLAKKRLVRFPDLVLFLLKSEKFKDDQSSKTIFLKPYGVEEKITICSYKLPDRHCEFYHDHRARIVGIMLICILLLGRSKSPMNVGFGKDIVTGAYKVVLMYLYDRIATKTLIKTHVFNLSNGERRCIYFPYVENQFNIDKISTFANGSLHWLNNNQTITALDLHTELFYEVLTKLLHQILQQSVFMEPKRSLMPM